MNTQGKTVAVAIKTRLETLETPDKGKLHCKEMQSN